MLPPFFFFFFSICASLLCLYSLGLLSLYIFMCVRAISKSPATIFQWALSHLCVYKRGSRDNMMTMAIFSCIKTSQYSLSHFLCGSLWAHSQPAALQTRVITLHIHTAWLVQRFFCCFLVCFVLFFFFFLNLSRCWLKCSSSFSLPNSH